MMRWVVSSSFGVGLPGVFVTWRMSAPSTVQVMPCEFHLKQVRQPVAHGLRRPGVEVIVVEEQAGQVLAARNAVVDDLDRLEIAGIAARLRKTVVKERAGAGPGADRVGDELLDGLDVGVRWLAGQERVDRAAEGMHGI